MDVTPDVRDVGFLVKLIYDAVDRKINRELMEHDLTNSQIAVLAFLRAREGSHTTIRDVQEFLGVAHPTVAGLVKRLEKKGFLHVLVDPEDHRARVLVLDDTMGVALDEAREPTMQMEEALLKDFSHEEREALREMLTRVYQNIK